MTSLYGELPGPPRKNSFTGKAHYQPPWADMSIIGIAGSSGSGKTSLAMAIVASLNLPWVVILSMDSFYKVLTPEQSAKAFRNEFDFDSPEAIDFDVLLEKLKDLKEGKKADVPIYSFEKHGREEETNTIYSPHVLVLEGIFALHDQRILAMLDMKIFAEADGDLCLSRRLLRDVKYRGRDIEGCIKQWFSYVKPNFHKYVEPQRNVADLIIPRGVENTVAMSMVSDRIRKILSIKSQQHQKQLILLGQAAEKVDLGKKAVVLDQKPQIVAIHTLLMNPQLGREDFVFNFDRVASLLIERAVSFAPFAIHEVQTPQNTSYTGLRPAGEISAVSVLRGGSVLETALKRVIPDCRTGRVLIQTNFRTGEPELHYRKLPADLGPSHALVLVLDAQMSSGGAALMAVRVLIDHGVREDSIVFVAYTAGKMGVARLLTVFPEVRVVICRLVDDYERRWVEERYLGC